MYDDRRRSERLPYYVTTWLDCGDKRDRFGIAQNISTTGMLLATPSRFRIGDRAVLRLDDEANTTVPAQVVRLEMNRRTDASGTLRYLAAFHFREPLKARAHAALGDGVTVQVQVES